MPRTKIKAVDLAITAPVVGEVLRYLGPNEFNTVSIPGVAITGITSINKGVTAGMTGTTIVVADATCTVTSVITWTSQTTPVGFIEVIPGVGSFTINSSASETSRVFNYVITT